MLSDKLYEQQKAKAREGRRKRDERMSMSWGTMTRGLLRPVQRDK